MPPKTVQCVMCEEAVSKRSTLSLKELNCGDGRACRKHEEVIKLVEAFNDRLRLERELKKEMKTKGKALDRKMRIFNIVNAIQVLHTFFGIIPEQTYLRLRSNGYPLDVVLEAKQEIEKKGSIMSGEERLKCLATASLIHQGELL